MLLLFYLKNYSKYYVWEISKIILTGIHSPDTIIAKVYIYLFDPRKIVAFEKNDK